MPVSRIPWPKGVSGNPGGRPKRDLAAEIARAIFEKNPKAIEDAMLRALRRGDANTFRVLAERGFGKLPQTKEVTGSDGQPVEIVFTGERPNWLKGY